MSSQTNAGDPYGLNAKDAKPSYTGTALDSNNKQGAFVRAVSRHNNYLDAKDETTGEVKFPYEPNRYVVYLS